MFPTSAFLAPDYPLVSLSVHRIGLRLGFLQPSSVPPVHPRCKGTCCRRNGGEDPFISLARVLSEDRLAVPCPGKICLRIKDYLGIFALFLIWQ